MADRFKLVYVCCPVEECIKRDVKGMYKKALAGEIEQFTGVSSIYEEPTAAHEVIYTKAETIDESSDKLYRLCYED